MAGSESGWPPTPCLLAWPLDTLPSLLSCKPTLLGSGGGREFPEQMLGAGVFQLGVGSGITAPSPGWVSG